MIRTHTLLAMLGALWLAGCGAPDRDDAAASRDWPEPSPALWEATTEDGQRLYLFGTIHSLPDGADWRTPLLADAMEDSDIALVEIAELGDGETAEAEFEARAYAVGLPPILDRVPEADRAVLARALDTAGIEPDSMIHTESWAAALQLGNAARCTRTANGVDRAVIARVPQVRSMESHAEQFAIFDRLPDEAQVDLLMSVAGERGCEAGLDRVEAWLTGDLATLEAAITSGFRGNSDLQARLIDRRNAGYVADIVALHDARPEAVLLVAVGTGHMIGERGLPALLAPAGYRVRRIQ